MSRRHGNALYLTLLTVGLLSGRLMAQTTTAAESMPPMDMRDMPGMDAAQGGAANASRPQADAARGIADSAMGMMKEDEAPYGMLLIDQLEAFGDRTANGLAWDVEGWYGNDENKLWLRSEGDDGRGDRQGDLEALWNRSVDAFWATQLGMRHDFGEGPPRDWIAFGVQGLAPYWLDVEATGYLDPTGRTAARLRGEYELLLTRRLVLQSEAELNLYGQDDPARRIGSGLSDTQFGLRLRYEISRQFAPYLGANWEYRFGTTADYARQYRQPVFERQIVAGVRIWF